jgi:PAS domain S-box-containing protein
MMETSPSRPTLSDELAHATHPNTANGSHAYGSKKRFRLLSGLLMFSLALTLVLLLWSAKRQDQIAVASSYHLANTALGLQLSNLQNTLTDYTNWDEAYRNLVQDFDPDWFDYEFGASAYLRSTFGITSSFVIGPDNRALRHMHNMEIAEDALALNIDTHVEGGFSKLIQKARRPVDGEFQAAGGMVKMAGQVYFAAVRVVHPYGEDLFEEAAITPSNSSIAAFLVPLDEQLLQALAEDFSLEGLTLSADGDASGDVTLPIDTADGRRFGTLVWQIDRPSGYVLIVVLPGLLIVILFVGLLGQYVLNNLRRAQITLQKGEETFRGVLESSIRGVYIQSGGRTLFANEAFAQLYGYASSQEVIAMGTMDAHIAPVDGARLQGYRTQREESQPASSRYEFQALRKDGSIFWAEDETQTISWHGEPAVLTTVSDSSDRHEAQEALRTSEERFRNLVEGSVQGIVVHRNDKVLLANQAMADILGYEGPERLYGLESIDDYVHPDDIERTRSYRAQRAQGKKPPEDVELRVLRKDGSSCWVECRAMILDWEGKPAFQVVFSDITERKHAEDALRALNEELEERVVARTRELRRERDKAESYLDIANTMFLALDRQGKIILVNRKLCEVLGYAEEALVGQDWHTMCVPDDEAEERKRHYLDRIAQDSEAFVANQGAEFSMVTKSGELRTVTWSDSPILDDDGAMVGILGAAEDITDQRQTEMELRQAQRSEALANLAGGISHSLNNVLAPIILLSDMLQERLPADSDDQAFAAQIVESSRRANDLVKRILAFSRREEPQPIVCDIAALVEDTVELLRQTVAPTITIELDTAPSVGEVFADPMQIETVLMNLITNAAAAIGDKIENVGITLDRRHLETESRGLRAGDYALLTVADDGPGIPSDVLENIFNPFFTTKDVGEGTGLGLSIADGVIKRHGGALRVQSAPGAGAKFEVYLPLHDALEAA